MAIPPFLRYFTLAFALRCSAAASGQALYDNGSPGHPAPPNFPNGFEMTGWIEADDFALSTPARLESVKLYDLEVIGNFTGTVLWRVYANSANDKPGTLLHSGISFATHIATGYASGPYVEYSVDFSLGDIVLPAGVYWLALHNGQLSNGSNQYVYWESTGVHGTRPSQSDIGPLFAGVWLGNTVGSTPSELSFQVNGVPKPQVMAIRQNSGVPQISFTSTAGYDYRVEYKNKLTDSWWLPVPGAEMVAGTGSTTEVADPSGSGASQRFYRVVLL